MVECPYKNGDLIILRENYEIFKFHSETPTYWLFEAIESKTKKNVVVKVFILEGFSNINEMRDAWINEIKELQTNAEYQGLPIEYLDSGEVLKHEKTYFIIAFRYIQEEDDDEAIVAKISSESIDTPKDIDIKDKAAEMPVTTTDDFIEAEKMEAELVEEPKETEREMIPPPSASLPTPSAPAGRDKKVLAKPKRKEAILLKESEEAKEEALEEAPSAPAVGGRVIEIADDSMELDDEEYTAEYLKHISMDYFDRMNPQNYYPLTITISDIIEAKKAAVINPITGERKVQEQTELHAELKDPIVTVRPTIPGCSVVPNSINTDFSYTKDEITFYITPGVKGDILGKIEFLNEGKVIFNHEFEAKVVDPRYARVIAIYGIITSFIPKIITLLGVDLWLDTTLNDLWAISTNTIGNMNIASLIAIGGILPVIALSLVVRQRLKPKSSRVQYKLTDFRLKSLKSK